MQVLQKYYLQSHRSRMDVRMLKLNIVGDVKSAQRWHTLQSFINVNEDLMSQKKKKA